MTTSHEIEQLVNHSPSPSDVEYLVNQSPDDLRQARRMLRRRILRLEGRRTQAIQELTDLSREITLCQEVLRALRDRTPEEWQEITGIRVMDPDGWRGEFDPSWNQPISKAEFIQRASRSTVYGRWPA